MNIYAVVLKCCYFHEISVLYFCFHANNPFIMPFFFFLFDYFIVYKDNSLLIHL